MRACRRDCNIRVVRARRQNANAYRHRQCRTSADKEPCDKTMGRNYPKNAPCLAPTACASTFFLHGERTCAGAPCLVSITLARSHVGAITLNCRLPHFYAILMMLKRYFLTALSACASLPVVSSKGLHDLTDTSLRAARSSGRTRQALGQTWPSGLEAHG